MEKDMEAFRAKFGDFWTDVALVGDSFLQTFCKVMNGDLTITTYADAVSWTSVGAAMGALLLMASNFVPMRIMFGTIVQLAFLLVVNLLLIKIGFNKEHLEMIGLSLLTAILLVNWAAMVWFSI